MAELITDLFILSHKRMRMQDLNDAALFSAWIQDAHINVLHGKLVGHRVLKQGQFFHCEVEGDGYIASFIGFSNAIQENEFELVVSSEITTRQSDASCRILTETLTGCVKDGGGSTIVNIVDVSKSGVAFIAPFEMERGSKTAFEASVNTGLVQLDLEVKTCRRYEPDPSMFRIGCEIGPMGRVATALWNQYIRSVA